MLDSQLAAKFPQRAEHAFFPLVPWRKMHCFKALFSPYFAVSWRMQTTWNWLTSFSLPSRLVSWSITVPKVVSSMVTALDVGAEPHFSSNVYTGTVFWRVSFHYEPQNDVEMHTLTAVVTLDLHKISASLRDATLIKRQCSQRANNRPEHATQATVLRACTALLLLYCSSWW